MSFKIKNQIALRQKLNSTKDYIKRLDYFLKLNLKLNKFIIYDSESAEIYLANNKNNSIRANRKLNMQYFAIKNSNDFIDVLAKYGHLQFEPEKNLNSNVDGLIKYFINNISFDILEELFTKFLSKLLKYNNSQIFYQGGNNNFGLYLAGGIHNALFKNTTSENNKILFHKPNGTILVVKLSTNHFQYLESIISIIRTDTAWCNIFNTKNVDIIRRFYNEIRILFILFNNFQYCKTDEDIIETLYKFSEYLIYIVNLGHTLSRLYNYKFSSKLNINKNNNN